MEITRLSVACLEISFATSLEIDRESFFDFMANGENFALRYLLASFVSSCFNLFDFGHLSALERWKTNIKTVQIKPI